MLTFHKLCDFVQLSLWSIHVYGIISECLLSIHSTIIGSYNCSLGILHLVHLRISDVEQLKGAIMHKISQTHNACKKAF